MRVKLAALAVVIGCAVAGCGSPAPVRRAVPSPGTGCPQAADGHGAPGICAPRNLLLAPPNARVTPGPTYLDLSNNDPCVCGQSIKANGHAGLIVKANQGTGFIDSTAVPMVQSARAAGLVVGMYDFDQDYSIAEAQTFVSRLHAAGIEPNSPNTFPAFFDVEYGSFSYSGLLAQIRYVQAQGYRVAAYTGAWYWSPHAGCQWPSGITAWLSGYPTASPVCGLPSSLFVSHQFTDSPVDQSVYIGSDFSSYTAAVPPKPVDVHHYARYPTTRRKACKCSERAVVRSYDRLRAKQTASHHPHRAELKRLRHDAGLLDARIARVATRGNVGVWGAGTTWTRYHRRQRFVGLCQRHHGATVPRPKGHPLARACVVVDF